ncbi:glycoside hydrolase family 32 protein [Tsukamurella soli]|uniref:beta-fructofuranosidase n=1 Tax=Tsukamurella soli TaxID=644556 RepID=A0ABP8JSI6_9ACTN
MTVRDMEYELARAETAVADLRSNRNDRWYPRVHIAPPAGWINDPNGISFFGGRYQVYFQHHPYSAQWGPMHWGHVSSTDMVTWRREPIAMAPSLEEDRDGVFSGSAVADGDELVVFYTGHRWRNGRNEGDGNLQVQCRAVTTDGIEFTKQGVVVEGPAGLPHFRDPKVWRMGEKWFMVFGVCSADNRGEVWLYTSADGEAWDFDRILFRDPDPDAFMLECPDMFPLGDKWVLAYCPMGPKPTGYVSRNGHNAGYVVGDWAPGSDFVALTDYRLVDWGAEFYALQSFEAPDGRRIGFGWMGSFTVPPASQAEDGWSGQLAVPREFTLGDDLRVRALPIAEFAGLRSHTDVLGAQVVTPDAPVTVLTEVDSAEVELTIDLAGSTAERVGLAVNATPDGHATLVEYDDLARRVNVDRRNTGHGEKGYRSAPVDPGDELRLRVIVDRGSVEVFLGDGAETVSSLIFAADGPREIRLYTESGTATITSLVAHRLGSIWEND